MKIHTFIPLSNVILPSVALITLTLAGCMQDASTPASDQASDVHKPTESTTAQNPIQKKN